MAMTTSTYAPDALASLRDSFALHLDATRAASTSRIYLAALDGLIAHLSANGMPTAARSVRREHVESYIAARCEQVKPASLSVEFRALQQFWRWALEEEEIERSPMEKMRPPRVPDAPVPVVGLADRYFPLWTISPPPGRSCMTRPRRVGDRATINPSGECVEWWVTR